MEPSETLRSGTRLGPPPSEQSAPQHFPLSFAQERLWVLEQLETNSAAHNIPVALRLQGFVDIVALEHSLTEIIRRHEVLRTEFHAVDGQPRQVVSSATPLRLAISDISNIPAQQRQFHLGEAVRNEANRPFDLTRVPLIRASLLRFTSEDHVLLLTVHQMVFDSWSVDILLRELTTLYRSFSTGDNPEIPELPSQYANCAIWQRRSTEDGNFKRRLSYWRQKLASTASGVELPTDYGRPPLQTLRGSSQSVALEKTLVHGLRELGRRESVTFFVTLLTAFNVFLSRYCGQDDIVVGTLTSNRNQPEAQQLIGLFENMLVLRNDLSGDPSFVELLQRVRATAEEAFANEIPFEKVLDELRPQRDLSRSPLFQIMFELRTSIQENFSVPGLVVSPTEVENGAERFDLAVTLCESKHGVRARFGYNADLFDDSTISRMTEHFLRLLQGVIENSERPISQLPLLPDSERQKILIDWNRTATSYPDACVQQWIERQAEVTPEAVAVVFQNQHLTYRELNARANQLAHYLKTFGVGPDVLVGLCVERSLDMVVGVLGVLKAGGAYVPLDPAYPKDRVAYILEDAHAPVLLTQQSLLANLPRPSGTMIVLDTDWREISKESTENLPAQSTAHDLAYVIYTSGSTGKPKGVQIEHRAVVNFLTSMRQLPGLVPQDVLLAVTTLSFDIAGLELYLPLTTGARLVVASREECTDGKRLAPLIEKYGVTGMQATPATWRLLLDANWKGNSKLKILCGGEGFPGELAEQLLPRCGSLWNMYGPTETTIWSSVYRVVAGESGTVAIGRPIANTQMYILDSRMEPVPVGVAGELYIGGHGLARGYLNRPELTAEKFVDNPFASDRKTKLYRTGDLARYLADGNISFLGRADFQVKIRGFRIELGEIESLLARHPAVRSCVVSAREDKPGDRRLVAYLVLVAGHKVSNDELRAFLKSSLPEYMVPGTFITLAELPLTPNGKVNRLALPAPDAAQVEAVNLVPARDPLEQSLVDIWQHVLDIPRIGIRDNFFDLGGHSLLAARLLSEVEKVTRHQIPLSALFRGATIESLAQLIREGPSSGPDPVLTQIQAGNGGGLPFFAIASPGVDTLGYALLARHMGAEQPFYKLQASAPLVGDRPFTKKELQVLAHEYIAAMRAVQPEGPYCFGGMCEGVQIAEQMVLDLEAKGLQVGLLVVLDTWVLQNSQVRWLWYIDYYRERLRSLRNMHLASKLKLWKRALRKNFRSIAESGKPEVRSDWREFYWPGNGFKPARFRAPVLLFKKPKQPFYYVKDSKMGWGARSESGVEIQIVNFRHVEMLREPYVQLMGEKLASRMHHLLESQETSLEASEISSDDSSAAATSGRMA
jgi:amino acid adenylation domain-containing protein